MPGTRATNTFPEALNALLPSISGLKALPDAINELPWITDFENMLLEKIHAGNASPPAQNTGAPPPPSMGMPGMGGMPMDPMMGGMPPGAAMAPPVGPGGPPLPPGPAPMPGNIPLQDVGDAELARVLHG